MPASEGAAKPRGRVGLLILSAHPLPTLAVTAFSAGLCAVAQVPSGRAALVVAAVLTGQLAIGWSNDAIDAKRDAAVHRPDKPVAGGRISRGMVAISAAVAAVLSVLLAVLLGVAGWIPVVILVAGLLYNAGLKATIWSWLPYAVAFGSLPAAATLALPGHPWPAWWATAAGALLGVSAHCANVLPDLTADVATGVRGLPHRLGATATAVLGPVLLWLASAAILLGPMEMSQLWRWVALVLIASVATTGAAIGIRDPKRRELFLAVVVLVAVDLGLFAFSGSNLV